MPRKPNTRPTLIYWLIDIRPETIAAGWPAGKPFYCGKTVAGLNRRLNNHISDARKMDRPVCLRLRECGDHVRIQLMETVPPGGNWSATEKRWIALLRHSFPGALNTASGGQGSPGNIPSDETRAKIRAALTGKSLSPEHRAKISAALKGRSGKKQSPEHLAKLSAIRKGRKLSDEHKAKIGAAFRGKALSAEHKAKVSAAHLGKPKPALVGHVVTAETRMKISAAKKGHPCYAIMRAKREAANA